MNMSVILPFKPSLVYQSKLRLLFQGNLSAHIHFRSLVGTLRFSQLKFRWRV